LGKKKLKTAENNSVNRINEHKTPIFKPSWICTINAIPVQVWTGPEGYRRLKLPDFIRVGS
jgi:hypothetical protein